MSDSHAPQGGRLLRRITFKTVLKDESGTITIDENGNPVFASSAFAPASDDRAMSVDCEWIAEQSEISPADLLADSPGAGLVAVDAAAIDDYEGVFLDIDGIPRVSHANVYRLNSGAEQRSGSLPRGLRKHWESTADWIVQLPM